MNTNRETWSLAEFKPRRTDPMVDILDWFAEYVRNVHPTWSDDEVLAEAEVRAGNYAR
jgi:hypothetical protein